MANGDAQKKFGCIIGMHRSGTSLATHILGLVGVDLGPPDHFLDPQPDNPMGFFENRDITRLNISIFRHFGAEWNDPPPLSDGWEFAADLDDFRDSGQRIIAETFSGDQVAAWKDPRMSITLPFWRSIVAIEPVVLMVRTPAQVAASLATRNGIASEQACALWLRYTADAWINGCLPLVVAFEDVLEAPAAVGRRLSDLFGTAGALGDDELIEAERAVQKALRHHDQQVGMPGPLMESAVDLFELLLSGDEAAATARCHELRAGWTP